MLTRSRLAATAAAGVVVPLGLTCRLYPTPDGLAGTPTVEQLVHVLEWALIE